MRALGLIGFLVVIGVICVMLSQVILPHTQQVIRTQKKVEPQVKQMAGKDAAGFDARDSIKLIGDSPNGKLKSVTVSEIGAKGAMATYFGLQRGDVIIEIAPQGGALMPVSDMSTVGEAKDMLLSAFQNSQQVVIMRGGKKLTLPAAPTVNPTPTATPAAGDNGVVKIPTH